MPIKLERQEKVLNWIQEKKRSTITELSEVFDVSEVTVRRDLKVMEQEGFVRVMHGGSVHSISEHPEPPVLQRLHENEDIKIRIAERAASLVKDGESIFLGSGSTTLQVARFLKNRRNLTIITNALSVVNELAPCDDVTIIILGGMLRSSELSMIGHITEQSLQEVRVDKVIIGIRGVDLNAGLTNDHLPEVMTDRAILAMGSKLILVADHTKFGHIGSAFVAPIQKVTMLITDEETPQDMLRAIEEQGVEILVV